MEVDMELDDPEAEVSARIVCQEMDTLMSGIKFTTETQKDFPDEWGIPTLDTMWKMMDGGGSSSRRVGYKFYKKPVSSQPGGVGGREEVWRWSPKCRRTGGSRSTRDTGSRQSTDEV